MSMISIGGMALPEPSSYNVTLSDLDSENTTRNDNGVLIRDRVRGGIYKINVGWEALTRSQLQTITAAAAPAKMSVSFFDPTTGTSNVTKSMYSGDRSASLKLHLDESQRKLSRWDLSFDLIEY